MRPFRDLSSHLAVASTIVFAGSAAFLVLLCAPGPYFKDGGELAAAAHVLGVAHPTGFPLFCLAGKAFDLGPFGNAFFRLNVMSAVMAALTAAMVFALASAGGSARRARTILVVGPASFLASNAVWLHATTTEVYALSTAGLAATILLFVLAHAGRDARLLVLGWLGVGLGLGGHVTWPAYGFVAGLIVTVAAALDRDFRTKGVVGMMAVSAVAGAAVALYLPLAASRDPIMNWGDPSTLSALFGHMTGARIRQAFAEQVASFNPASMAAHASMAAGVLWRGTGPVLPLAAVGLWFCARRARVFGVILGSVLVLDFLFASWVNPMGTWDLQTMMSATLAVSILVAVGAFALWDGAGGPRARSVVAGVAIVAVGLQATMSGADRSMTRVDGSRKIATGLLADVPLGATLLTSSDDLSAGVAALQVVENSRPDVLHLVRQHLADTAYVARQVRAHRAFDADSELLRTLDQRPFEAEGEGPSAAQARLLSILDGRGNVYLEPGDSGNDAPIRGRLVPDFPAYRLGDGEIGREALLRGIGRAMYRATDALPGCDRWGRAFVGVYLRLLATNTALTGAGDRLAIGILRKALSLNPGDSRTLQNLGVLVFNSGRRSEGLDFMQRSVSIDAAYVRGWETLARYAAIAGETALESRARSMVKALSR